MNSTGKNGDFGARVDQPLNLLPGDVADAVCADFMGKAVKNSDALRV
jgi:hypothetical protein